MDRVRRGSNYSRLQTYFLLRAARLGKLAERYAREGDAPDEYGMLIAWALRSTLEDCTRLDVYAEAIALALHQER